MPKPLKRATKAREAAKRKPPSDPNRAAHAVLAEHLARHDPDPGPTASAPLDFQAAYTAHMKALGAKGGQVGGKRRLETMTQDERSAVASKAARAMWARKKRSKAR